MKVQQAIGAAVLVVALLAAVTGAAWQPRANVLSRDTVAVIRVEGTISGGGDDGVLAASGGARADRLVDALDKARKDPSVKAVVLRVNSPGGAAGATYEIAREVGRLKEAGKKVVASVGDAAASGGYYIASQADYIYATPGTLTGSIGVIISLANLEELYKKIGYKPDSVSSGQFKEIGTPNRPMTDEERRIFQGIVDRAYADFVNAVATGRKLPVEEVRRLADGRIFDGAQARDLRLVDDLGNSLDAVRKAADLAGLKEGQYQVKEMGKFNPFEQLMKLPATLAHLAQLLEQGPGAVLQRQAPLEVR